MVFLGNVAPDNQPSGSTAPPVQNGNTRFVDITLTAAVFLLKRAAGDMPLHATRYAEYARADGCVAFCGDSIAAMLLTPNVGNNRRAACGTSG